MQSKRDEFFFQKLKERYNEVWKSKGGTYESFGKALGEVSGLHSVGHQQVGKWIRGETFPEEWRPHIAKVLGVEESYFFPSTDSDRYQFDEGYITTELGRKKDDTMKDIGLDECFLFAVKRITQFGDDFPMYTPIIPQLADNPSVSLEEIYPEEYRDVTDENGNPDEETEEEKKIGVRRYLRASSAPMSDGLRELYQFERDGETYTLNPRDMLFLKEVQDKVGEYIEFLFAQRVKEMKREEVEALRYLVPSRGARGRRFTPEAMNEIDRFGNWKLEGDKMIMYNDERSGKKWQA